VCSFLELKGSQDDKNVLMEGSVSGFAAKLIQPAPFLFLRGEECEAALELEPPTIMKSHICRGMTKPKCPTMLIIIVALISMSCEHSTLTMVANAQGVGWVTTLAGLKASVGTADGKQRPASITLTASQLCRMGTWR
jgi:hypothetical protein